jgi:dTDP-4-amino-4,6-dideoxygalactose transaminase
VEAAWGRQAMIPFNRPFVSDKEVAYIHECLAGRHIAGDGPFTKRCQQLLETLCGSRKALLTTSCTDALELAALLLDVRPGDEVIAPSFTFASTVNAFILRGARPVFADIRPDTLNLDEAQVARLIGPRTRAIIPVHYAGVACEMDALAALSRQHRIPLVEDNAGGLFGTYRGRRLGTFGTLATLSFHETKNISCGEGGALLINDEALIERAEILREKGTDRSRFLQGLVDTYTWVDIGSSFLPSDMLAAFLCAQLESHEQIQIGRRRIWGTYQRELSGWASAKGVRLPYVPPHCEQPYHMFYLLMPEAVERNVFIAYLKSRDIQAVFHYQPLHRSAMGRRLSPDARCPVSEDVSARLVRLPFYNGMLEEEQERVIAAVRGFQRGRV